MNYIALFPQSALLYTGVLFLCLLLAVGADKQHIKGHEKIAKAYVWFIILALTLLIGLRGKSVGLDTGNYILTSINVIKSGNFAIAYGPIGYKLFVRLVLKLTNSIPMVFVAIAFVTSGLSILRLWDFRGIASFPLMAFLYFTGNFAMQMNIFRQCMAVAVVFYATRYLFQDKLVKYCILVALSATIHTASVLGFLLLPVYLLAPTRDAAQRRKRTWIMIAFPIMLALFAFILYRYFNWQRYMYLIKVSAIHDIGLLLFAQLALFLAMQILMKTDPDMTLAGVALDAASLRRLINAVYFTGIIFSATNYFYANAGRIGLYFMMFEPVFAAYNYAGGKQLRFLFRTVFFLLACYSFYSALKNSGNGIMPYVPFWR